MRVLLDRCVWGGAREVLAAEGHEVEWVGDWAGDPGDAEILAHAAATRAVVVTLDKDFGDLAVVRGLAHAGIVRIAGFRAREQGAVCVRALARYGPELPDGALVTVERARPDPARASGRCLTHDSEAHVPGGRVSRCPTGDNTVHQPHEQRSCFRHLFGIKYASRRRRSRRRSDGRTSAKA